MSFGVEKREVINLTRSNKDWTVILGRMNKSYHRLMHDEMLLLLLILLLYPWLPIHQKSRLETRRKTPLQSKPLTPAT